MAVACILPGTGYAGSSEWARPGGDWNQGVSDMREENSDQSGEDLSDATTGSSGNSQADPLAPLLDRLADRFEAEWKAGRRPQLASFAASVPAEARAKAIYELARVDM